MLDSHGFYSNATTNASGGVLDCNVEIISFCRIILSLSLQIYVVHSILFNVDTTNTNID